MKKPEKKASHFPSNFDFCPKHKSFFISCGCKNKRIGKSQKVDEDNEEENEDETNS